MTCLSILTEDRPATVAANPIFILSQVDDRRGAEIAFEVFEEDAGILKTLIGKKRLYYINPPEKIFWGELTELDACTSALSQTDGTGSRSSLARMASADWVQTKGFGLVLCSAR